MDIPMDADVLCEDGYGGHSIHVMLDPEKQLITHLIVKIGLLGTERLVPIELVSEATPTAIQLACTTDELKQMPPFVHNMLVKPVEPSGPVMGGGVLVAPYSNLQQRTVLVEHEEIPEGEVVVGKGASVEALDGHLGQVTDFLIDSPPEGKITHLVAEEGHFWNRKHLTIPVLSIDHIGHDTVYLKLARNVVEAADIEKDLP